MKKLILFCLTAVVFFSQCTPKTGDVVTKTEDKMTKAGEKVETVVDKAKTTTFRSQAPAAGPAPKIQMGSYENFKLPNGLQVIVVENHKLPRVSFQLFVDAPIISEKESVGYIDMAGDLMSKGTKTRTKAQIDEEVDFMGATMVSDGDGLYGACLTKHMDKLMNVMSDILLNPAFPQDEFDKSKKQILSSLAQEREDPNAISGNVSQVLRYGKDHPYGEISTEETIENITLNDCKNYYNTYFKPNISYLVVVGDITSDQVKPMIENYFKGWKADNSIQKSSFPQPQMPASTSVDFVNKTGAVQSVIAITYPIDLKPGAKDVIPASVLNTLLGGYFQSRLNQNLRETNAYTYGARSSLVSNREVGYFTAGASVRNEVTDSSLTQFMYELGKVRTELVGADELELVINSMSGRFARSLESPQTVARFALNTFRHNLPKDYYANYLENLSKVTPADVMAMAKKYIRPDRAHVVVVGSKSEVAENLGQFAKSGEVNYYDVFGNKIEMSSSSSADISADQVIKNYISAIGGAEKCKAIKDIVQEYEAEVQGMKINNSFYRRFPDRFAMLSSMNGSVMMSQIYDGEKGMMSGMGGDKEMAGDELKKLVANAHIFTELYYNKLGYKTKVEGVEKVNGKDAYVLSITNPAGDKSTDYYDKESGLKVKTVITQEQNGQTSTQNIEFMDYKETGGVKFPTAMKITGGGMPFPLMMKEVSIKINEGIDDSVFTIE